MRNSERIQRELLKKKFLDATWKLRGKQIEHETVEKIIRGFELIQSCRCDLAAKVMESDEIAAMVWKEANA